MKASSSGVPGLGFAPLGLALTVPVCVIVTVTGNAAPVAMSFNGPVAPGELPKMFQVVALVEVPEPGP